MVVAGLVPDSLVAGAKQRAARKMVRAVRAITPWQEVIGVMVAVGAVAATDVLAALHAIPVVVKHEAIPRPSRARGAGHA